MAHPRQEIRHAVATQLTGATAAGTRVFRTRVLPYKRVELPALAVYTPTETVNVDVDTAPRELERSPELVIEGAVKAAGSENVDDALDAMALEIENALHADPTFGGVAADAVLSSTELDIIEDGDTLVGLVKLTYKVEYFAPAAVPPVLDDFKTADIRHNLSGAQHVDNQAHDSITGLEE